MNDSTRVPAVIRWLVVVPLVCTLIGVIEAAFIGYDWLSGGSLSLLRAPDQGRGVRTGAPSRDEAGLQRLGRQTQFIRLAIARGRGAKASGDASYPPPGRFLHLWLRG